MEIKELSEGLRIAGLKGLVESQSVAMTKAGKPFLRMTLRDKSGSISGVMWDFSQERDGWVKEGQVVEVDGEVSTYQGALQFKFESVMHSAQPAMSFAKVTKFDVEALWSFLVEKVGSFTEPLTKYVAEEILLKQGAVVEALKKAPAAKGVHNAWFGGLLEHIWSLCSMAEPIIKHYQRPEYFPRLSRDKVLFGLMVHDAGKIVEYDFSTPAFQVTALGALANHMVLGPAWVFEAAGKWWAREQELQTGNHKEGPATKWDASRFKRERAQLMHVLAAHHGQIEWGSPVEPSTVEAVLVHHLDNLDAKVLHALDYVLGKPGPVPYLSEKSFIERHSFYQPGEFDD